jgi:hypothetical protein
MLTQTPEGEVEPDGQQAPNDQDYAQRNPAPHSAISLRNNRCGRSLGLWQGGGARYAFIRQLKLYCRKRDIGGLKPAGGCLQTQGALQSRLGRSQLGGWVGKGRRGLEGWDWNLCGRVRRLGRGGGRHKSGSYRTWVRLLRRGVRPLRRGVWSCGGRSLLGVSRCGKKTENNEANQAYEPPGQAFSMTGLIPGAHSRLTPTSPTRDKLSITRTGKRLF